MSRDPIRYVDGASLYRAYFVPNRTDPTGLIWTPGYGAFCGPRNGPGPAIDLLDEACEVHDTCLATPKEWLDPCNLVRCDLALCAAARGALLRACSDTPPGNEAACIAAATAIAAYACRWLPPLYFW